MEKNKGFGVRMMFNKAYDLESDADFERFTLTVLKVIEDGGKIITAEPLEVYFFETTGSPMMREHIARAFRMCAYKIQKGGTVKKNG